MRSTMTEDPEPGYNTKKKVYSLHKDNLGNRLCFALKKVVHSQLYLAVYTTVALMYTCKGHTRPGR